VIAASAPSIRDSWATPQWLTRLLPVVDLDPCSNHRSTVRARKTYSLERDEDGLALPWFGVCYVNPPFSDVMPWVERAESPEVVACGFLVNVDSSTAWWRRLQKTRSLALMFHKRIQFSPPPGVAPSSNSKPQALVCDLGFWMRCDPALATHGTLWGRL
jgi:hypothetical protein